MNFKMWKSFLRRVFPCRPRFSDWPVFLRGLCIVLLFGRLFYASWLAVVLLLPLILPYYAEEKRRQLYRYNRTLGMQFRDAILSVSAGQKAGYSIENAFLEAQHDMRLLHGRTSPICTELTRISKGLSNNIVLEQLLYELGERSGNKDIREFASVFAVAKRSGGNMTRILAETAALIGNRMEVEKEIDVIVSAKRLEARIMEVVPFFIILYVGLSNRGFFTPLYHNPPGIAIMSVCLAVYIAAYLMIERIAEIRI